MKITFIQTGGTIDKDYPKTTKGYAFEIGEAAVRRILQKANPCVDLEIISVLKKDSSEISNDDRGKILEACQKAKSNKIIITHGTDTMLETARKLSNIKDKAIVITGAMRPEKFSDSDASFNVGMAVGAINALRTGVYIAMNGMIYPREACKRDLNTGQFVKK